MGETRQGIGCCCCYCFCCCCLLLLLFVVVVVVVIVFVVVVVVVVASAVIVIFFNENHIFSFLNNFQLRTIFTSLKAFKNTYLAMLWVLIV